MDTYISQPTIGYSLERLVENEKDIFNNVKDILGEDLTLQPRNLNAVEFVAHLESRNPIYYVGKALQKLSDMDVIIFAGDWAGDPKCCIEFYALYAYSYMHHKRVYTYSDTDSLQMVDFKNIDLKGELIW